MRSKNQKLGVGRMFDAERTEFYQDWRPPTPPSLHNVKEIVIDYETTGLRWWDKDHPVGVAYCLPDGTTGYLPWEHESGYNLPKENVIAWLKDLRGIHIMNASMPFEVHMSQTIGVDLEEQGCTVTDVQHTAALLDDHRRQFRLAELCKTYLPAEERKITIIDGEVLDGARMAEYPSGMIAIRAEADVRQVYELLKVLRPQIIAQDLTRVQQLEDDVIFAACEMERNALPMDVPLLHKWYHESEQRMLRYLWRIHKETGLNFKPGSAKSWGDLLKKLGIEWDHFTESGLVDTTDVLVKKIDHPVVQLARKAAKLADLKSDYIDKYYKTVGTDGLLRFKLHQLKSDDGGTVSGRFSASAITIGREKIGCNPQQVPDVDKQVEKGHDEEYIIRKLFIGGRGSNGVASADARQIEYRLFADYARNPEIMKAYAEDPLLSFHKFTHTMLLPYRPDLSYGQQKNVNFMKVYCGGLVKLAVMLDYMTPQRAAELRAEYAPKAPPRTHPELRDALIIDDIYSRVLPEVKPLTERAMHAAKSECDRWCNEHDKLHSLHEHQGFVRTLTGRRSRYPYASRLHKALNNIIQGGAADIFKQKAVEVHRARKRIGFVPRLPNHDEFFGDQQTPETARLLSEILNEQSFKQLKIPILWDVKTGMNWAEC